MNYINACIPQLIQQIANDFLSAREAVGFARSSHRFFADLASSYRIRDKVYYYLFRDPKRVGVIHVVNESPISYSKKKFNLEKSIVSTKLFLTPKMQEVNSPVFSAPRAVSPWRVGVVTRITVTLVKDEDDRDEDEDNVFGYRSRETKSKSAFRISLQQFRSLTDVNFLPASVEKVIFAEDVRFDGTVPSFAHLAKLKTIRFIQFGPQHLTTDLAVWPKSLTHLEYREMYGTRYPRPAFDQVKIPQTLKIFDCGLSEQFLPIDPRTGVATIIPMLPLGLTELGYECSVREYDLPNSITTLSLRQSSLSIEKWRVPKNLTSLKFFGSPDSSVSSLVLPAGLRHLEFAGACFNEDLSQLILPPTLESFILSSGSYQYRFPDLTHTRVKELKIDLKPILPRYGYQAQALPEEIMNPYVTQICLPVKGFETLIIGGVWFNQSLDGIVMPEGMTKLSLGDKLKHSLANVRMPASLRELHLGYDFDSSLPDLRHTQLAEFTIPNKWSQPINNLRLPATCKRLEFGYEFNRSVDGLMLPEGLTYLDFGCAFNQPIASLKLPSTLQKLQFGHGDEHAINFEFPDSS